MPRSSMLPALRVKAKRSNALQTLWSRASSLASCFLCRLPGSRRSYGYHACRCCSHGQCSSTRRRQLVVSAAADQWTLGCSTDHELGSNHNSSKQDRHYHRRSAKVHQIVGRYQEIYQRHDCWGCAHYPNFCTAWLQHWHGRWLLVPNPNSSERLHIAATDDHYPFVWCQQARWKCWVS